MAVARGTAAVVVLLAVVGETGDDGERLTL